MSYVQVNIYEIIEAARAKDSELTKGFDLTQRELIGGMIKADRERASRKRNWHIALGLNNMKIPNVNVVDV